MKNVQRHCHRACNGSVTLKCERKKERKKKCCFCYEESKKERKMGIKINNQIKLTFDEINPKYCLFAKRFFPTYTVVHLSDNTISISS